MSLIVKVKKATLIITDNPYYFNAALFIMVSLIAYFIYGITYKVQSINSAEIEERRAVYYDLLRQTEIDQIKPVIQGADLKAAQWALNDSVAAIRKKNFESLFVHSNELIDVNIDIPLTIDEKELFNNIAYQAVNYAHIIKKRAPGNNIKTLHLFTSEKVFAGQMVALDFDYNRLLAIPVTNKIKPAEIMKYAKVSQIAPMSTVMIQTKKNWCLEIKEKIPMCK